MTALANTETRGQTIKNARIASSAKLRFFG